MNRTRYTFFIDPDVRDAIAAIKERDGIPESEQIRRALRAWVETRAVQAKQQTQAGKRTKTTKGRQR